VELVECDTCGRNFNTVSIKKHAKVCKKVFVDKRKAFDVEAMRKPEEVLTFEKENKNKKKKKDDKGKDIKDGIKKVPKWKQQSEAFRNAMNAGNGEPQQYVVVDDRKECPLCNRKFGEDA